MLRYADWLDEHPDLSLNDVCATQALHRSAFPWRFALGARDQVSLVSALRQAATGDAPQGSALGRAEDARPGVAFVFSGQGGQWWGMARDLMDGSPSFMETLRLCATTIQSFTGRDLEAELRKDEESSIIGTSFGQLALLAVQMASVSHWASLGVRPAAVVGHSIGEVAAAWTAGVIGLEDAIRIVYQRMLVLDEIAGFGTMLAVGLSEKDAERYLAESGLSSEIGTVNGPSLVTFSGARDELERAAADLEAKGVYAKFLKVTGPFHSRHIERYRERIVGEFAYLRPASPTVPYYSSVSGSLLSGPVFDADYTYRNLRQRVRFAQAIERMIDDGWTSFVEIGPHPSLVPYVAETATARRRPCQVLPTLRRKENDWDVCLATLAALHVQGCDVDIGAPWKDGTYVRQRPPAYPFQKERYWFEKAASRASRMGRRVHPLVASRSDLPGREGTHAWKLMLSKRVVPWIAQHVVQGGIIFPAAGICETALGCAQDAFGERFVALEDLRFMQGVYLPKGDEEEQEIVLSVSGDDGSFSMASRPADASGAWTTHCAGRMTHRGRAPDRDIPDVAVARASFTEADRDDFEPIYRKMAENGLELGPSFRAIRRIWIRAGGQWLGEAYGEVEADERDGFDLDSYNIHPAVLDSCWQILIPVIVRHTGDDDMLCLPVSVGSFRLLRAPRGVLSCYGRLRSTDGRSFVTDVWVYDAEGRPCLEILGFTVRHIEGTGHDAAARVAAISYRPSWNDAPLVLAEGAVKTLPSDMRPGGTWLVFMDAAQSLGGVVAGLRELGERVVVALPGVSYDLRGDEATLARQDAGDMARLVAEMGPGSVRGLVYGWSLDRATAAGQAFDDGSAAALETLALLRPLCALPQPPRTWVLTRQASDAGPDPDPALAGAVGVARVAMHEHPALALTLVDMDSDGAPPLDEFLRRENDEEVAWLGDRRVARVIVHTDPDRERLDALKPLDKNTVFGLSMDMQSGSDTVALRTVQAPVPGPGQVEVLVSHVALDTKGRLSGPADAYPARAFSGVVGRVGPGVAGCSEGDAVAGVLAAAPANRLSVDARRLRVLKPGADLAQAAAAEWNGLVAASVRGTLAGLAADASVVVVASPSSPWRELVAALGTRPVSVAPVGGLDSAELERAGAVAVPEGAELGADAVVCLAAEANLYLASRSLRHGGMIVVADRACLDAGGQVPASVLSRCSSVTTVDVAELDGAHEALPGPFRLFPLAQASEAMSARRAGPCAVLDLGATEGASLSPARSLAELVRADATYVVTGGLKGLGLAISEFLCTSGARHLVLVGRSGADSDEARAGLAKLEDAGAVVRVVRGDVSDPSVAESLFRQDEFPPVRGVVHCAAVFDDALLADMDAERFLGVYGPKARGAFNLHRAAGPMDFFLCFSSVSAAYGNPSQANYAAANAYLDSLCLSRRVRGLGGLALAWGVIGGAGYVARNGKVADMLGAQGWKPLSLRDIAETLDAYLPADPGYRLVMDLDWAKLGQINPADRSSARFGALTGAGSGSSELSDSLADRLATLDPTEAKAVLEAELSAQVARIAGLALDDVDPDEPITALGLDSLMVNQLRNWIMAALKTQVTMMKLMMGPSVRALAGSLLDGSSDAATEGNESSPFSKPIPAAPDADSYPVTSSQRRVLLLSHLDPSSVNYNIPVAVRIRADVDPERALAAFRTLVQSYETLRTSFVFEGGEFRQRVHSRVDIEAAYDEFPETDVDLRLAAFFKPFDLGKAPLCRALVAKLAERDYLLVIEMHHSIIDANSGGILLDAFFRIYSGSEPEPERVRYRDYAVWEAGLRANGAYAGSEAFWLDRLKGPLPSLDLPTDFPRPRRQSFEGDEVRFRLGPARVGQLKDLAAKTGATLSMVLLAAFKTLLHRYTGQEDMIVGLPASARRHADLERLMGMLVSTIPLRSVPASRKRFVDYLTELKGIAIESYENQDYPFDDLFERLVVDRELSRNPLYDVSFTFQDVDLSFSALAADGSVDAYRLPRRAVRFALGLECFERAEGVDVA
ncbi:MAG TPA: SDR family NAD(P)-dependent oxidoreductase, partial [Spirochaetales bacterium]|nr:SDR family NAD(P)-dependent oxidoreductase [Spirochaetales bacterium]